MTIDRLPNLQAICRLDPAEEFPVWALGSSFLSITRTPGELSIVCDQDRVPAGVRYERDWRGWAVAGPLDLALVGILDSIVRPLAEAGLSVFAISTFETDYVLVRENDQEKAVEALRKGGHDVT